MKKKITKKKRIFFVILNAGLVLFAAACFIVIALLSNLHLSQKEAQRWQGESEIEFAQLSCYIPVDEKIDLGAIYTFRTAMISKFHEAALDIDNDDKFYIDAWSTTAKVNAATTLGKADVSAIVVGGEFFAFHPIRLLSGAYISESDLMKDMVLLDEDLAWLLFGGTDLTGMELKIDGMPFIVAGVIAREDDFASEKAYTAGMGLYMSYDAYASMNENAGINSYEVVMAEPVDGFALSFAKEKFPIGNGEIIENSNRYSFGRLFKQIWQFGTRSMQTLGVTYPYWENAARLVEDWCILLLFLGLAASVLPVVTAALIIIRYAKKGKDKVEDDLVPRLKENTQEAIRVRQRRRWEKKHGYHEKK